MVFIESFSTFLSGHVWILGCEGVDGGRGGGRGGRGGKKVTYDAGGGNRWRGKAGKSFLNF